MSQPTDPTSTAASDAPVAAPPGHRPLAVVTGASRGIGEELARQFAAHGFDLVLVAEDGAVDTVAAGYAGQGVTAHAVRADLATREGVAEVVRSLDALERPVDAAALNAGVGAAGRFTETELDDDLRVVALNVTSTVHLAKVLLRRMVARGQGRMLVTSSVAATMPGPYYATYAASKAFLQSFAEAVRAEVADSGVTVTSLMPGPTDTDFFDRAGMQGSRAAGGPKDDPGEVARQGYEALMAGRDHVVAGSLRNTVQAAAAGVLPDALAARLHGSMTKPRAGAADDDRETGGGGG